MKFGKSYREVLADPTFPEDWKKGAVQYNNLKKLLNGVVDELESIGLSPGVIEGLLNPQGEGRGTQAQDLSEAGPSNLDGAQNNRRATPADLLQVQGDLPNDAGLRAKFAASEWLSSLPDDYSFRKKQRRKRKPRSNSTGGEPFFLPTPQTSPDTFVLNPEKYKREGVESARQSLRRHSSSGLERFRLIDTENAELPPIMLVEDANLDAVAEKFSHSQIGNSGVPSAGSPEHDWTGSNWTRNRVPKWFSLDEGVHQGSYGNIDERLEPRWIESTSGRRAWAEYNVLGDSLDLRPELVVHIESPDSLSLAASPDSLQSSQVLTPLESRDNSPDTATDTVTNGSKGDRLSRLDLGAPAQHIQTIVSAEVKKANKSSTSHGFHQRRVVIPLTSDEKFFKSLSDAVRQLLQLHLAQQQSLIRHVNEICKTISDVASPLNTPKDMYAWREIFTLWIEHEIFESSRERDRGELSVAESEKRLRNYIEELVKRRFLAAHKSALTEQDSKATDTWEVEGLNRYSPLADPRSVQALDHFLRLNVALVSLKRFQRLNIEMIRKILKKHEKKTALDISKTLDNMLFAPGSKHLIRSPQTGLLVTDLDLATAKHIEIFQALSSFIPMRLAAPSQTSLPNILASILTKALLPILPSMGAYDCPVCMSIAYQPVRLRCDHVFCIRCMVKMQKQGTRDCPMCRSKHAVEEAGEENLDVEMTEYLRAWFPTEVEEKVASNKSDRSVEERKEAEMHKKKKFVFFRRGRRSEQHDQDCTIV